MAAQTALRPQDQRVPIGGDCHFYGLCSTEPRETLRWAEAGDGLSGSPSLVPTQHQWVVGQLGVCVGGGSGTL